MARKNPAPAQVQVSQSTMKSNVRIPNGALSQVKSSAPSTLVEQFEPQVPAYYPIDSVGRLLEISNESPSNKIRPDTYFEYDVYTLAGASTQLDNQVTELLSDLRDLEHHLRPILPNSAYGEPAPEAIGQQYSVQSGADSPALEALAYVANRIIQARRDITWLINNVTR